MFERVYREFGDGDLDRVTTQRAHGGIRFYGDVGSRVGQREFFCDGCDDC